MFRKLDVSELSWGIVSSDHVAENMYREAESTREQNVFQLH